MKTEIAKNIGSTVALKSLIIGLICAYIIMILVSSGDETNFYDGLFWIFRINTNVLGSLTTVIAVFCACGYYFGGQAGVAILIKQNSYLWVGPLWGLCTLLTTAFSASIISLNFNNIAWIVLYISVFGLIPALLVGLWFGWSVNRKGKIL